MFLVCLALSGGRAKAADISANQSFTTSIPNYYNVTASVTVTLNTINMAVAVVSDKPIFIVKNGITLTLVLNGANSYTSDKNYPFVYLDKNAKLVIKAGTGAASLTLKNNHADGVSIGRTSPYYPYPDDNSWEVMVQSGTVNIDKFGGGTGVAGNGEQGVSGGHLKIYGGTVTASLKGGKGGKGKNATIRPASHICNGTSTVKLRYGEKGGAGGVAPKLSVYGGTVNITSIAVGEGGAYGDGMNCSSQLVVINDISGAEGGKGDVVIAGGSVTISNAGGANAALNKPSENGGTAVVRNTITFDNANAPTGVTAGVSGVSNRNVLCGKIGNILCDSASKWHSAPLTRDTLEKNGVYGLKDVKTDANGKFYPWLPTASSNEVVELSLYGNCTPLRGTRAAGGTSATLKWESIKITYKCAGVGCNTAFEDQIITQPPTCN